MSKLLAFAIATAGVTPFVVPIPASRSAPLGSRIMVCVRRCAVHGRPGDAAAE